MRTFDNPAINRCLTDIQAKVAAHGVSLVLGDGPRVPYGTNASLQVSGYFIDRPKVELAVALGKPEQEWLGVLIHEACHMEQWIEQSSAWTNVFVAGKEAVDWIDDWLEGEEELPEPIEELVARARTVELDCERRVVDKIHEYGLPLDVEEYAQKANSYVYFYNHLLRARRWYPAGCSPYENELVYGFAPTVLTLDGQTPPSLAAAFERVYPSKKRMVNP